MKSQKWIIPFILLIVTFLVMPAVASAHVTVHPSESSTNAWEKYSVRVPVEKDIHTTSVELHVPEGIHLVSVMPVDGWDYEFNKDENESITTVTWTATDEGIGPNEFTEFYFVASNPSETGEFSWDAFQTYEDGSVVEWVGAPDTDEPASVTKVIAGDGVAQHGDNDSSTSANATQEESNQGNGTSTTANWLPISLAGLAILLALISLFRKQPPKSK